MDCDGRFCSLDEHPEMKAIKRIAGLEAENQRLREVEKMAKVILAEAEDWECRTGKTITWLNPLREALLEGE